MTSPVPRHVGRSSEPARSGARTFPAPEAPARVGAEERERPIGTLGPSYAMGSGIAALPARRAVVEVPAGAAMRRIGRTGPRSCPEGR